VVDEIVKVLEESGVLKDTIKKVKKEIVSKQVAYEL
jgi:hypothetical protein